MQELSLSPLKTNNLKAIKMERHKTDFKLGEANATLRTIQFKTLWEAVHAQKNFPQSRRRL